MKIDKTTFAYRNSNSTLMNLKNTGYAATGSIALAVVTGLFKNKSVRKSHQFSPYFLLYSSGYISTVLSILLNCIKNQV